MVRATMWFTKKGSGGSKRRASPRSQKWSTLRCKTTALNKQEKDAPHYICKVVASLLSPVVWMLRNICGGREQRLFLAGRYLSLACEPL